tara:strand:+ start:2877 stop:3122 length:246 start_codon:yes stop_codon:yes gene_type:complete
MGQETNLEDLSTEELKALKKKRVDFMKDALEDLRVQDEYTLLKANISENSLRDYMSQMKLVNLKMPKPEAENVSDTKVKKK